MNSRAPTLHLICGLPGSGKSTLALKLERELPAVRFSPDEWLLRAGLDVNDEKARASIESIQWEMAQRILSLGMDTILEFGFWTRAERVQYRMLAASLGAKTRLYFLDVPLPELERRIEMRNKSQSDRYVNPAKLDCWVQSFGVPAKDELTS